MPLLVRVVFKMRGQTTMEWCNAKARHWDGAVRGSSALRMAMHNLMLDEMALSEGTVRAAVYWDLEKFYDSIALRKMILAAMANEYPLTQLLMATRCYLGPRMVLWCDIVDEWIMPSASICAGCVQANHMARVIVYELLDRVHMVDPRLELSQYVDAVETAATGRMEQVKKLIAMAVDAFERGCRDLKLVISKPKTGLVTTSRQADQEIRKSLKRKHEYIKVQKVVRYLGADATGARRRSARTEHKRRDKAKKRQKKVRRLGVGAVAQKAYKTATWAQLEYNVALMGASDTALARMRAMARFSTMTGNQGTCTTTTIALKMGEREDPFSKVVAVQVREWCSWWERHPDLRLRATKCWVAAKRRLGELKKQQRWRQARGPMAAMILTLNRIGWNPLGPAVWKDPEGATWANCDNTDLADLYEKIHADAMKVVWKKAGQHYQATGLEEGVD